MIRVRGIAFKIFLSFWLIFAVLIATFAILPNRGSDVRFTDHVRQHGLIALGVLETRGERACADLMSAVAERIHVQLALFDSHEVAVCHAPGADLTIFQPLTASTRREVGMVGSRTLAAVTIENPAGINFIAAGAALPIYDVSLGIRPPFPYGPVGIVIVVSGIVCFAVARYLARPLQHVRDVSYRLAAGDLRARVGPRVAARRDEIGDLVHDFDAMASRIEALVQSQSQLLSDISHELRSPLARLNVALELGRRKAGLDAQADLERIEVEADRMNELIGRILALARAESREASTTSESVDLADVVRRVTDDARYEAQRQQKSVVLRTTAAPTVNGDPRLIASAVDNIVRNAIRYTPERSSVDVVIDRAARDAVITVRDHGPGAPQSELERIFAPFHRVESARDRESGGVGLGLTIARRAIHVHGGSITAENVSDGGLRVTIRIPTEDASPPVLTVLY